MNAFFRNALVYRLESGWRLDADALDEQLARMCFAPGTSVQSQSIGWVPAVEHGRLAHVVGGQVLLTLRVEKKLLPASVVNQFARARAQEQEERQGYKPGRRQLREIKEAVTEELIPKAFSIFRDTRVWLDPLGGWLAIDTSSPTRAEEVIGILSKSLDPFPLRSLQVRSSPAAAMTAWLTTDEPPAGFAIDQDAELQASGESRAAVRFLRESIDAEDVRRHVAAGKRCTRLALTWHDRVSFVLTESLALKRIVPLDVLKEGDDDAADAAERFDSDFALMAGELSRLLGDLVQVLGGEAQASDRGGDPAQAIAGDTSSRAVAGEAVPA